MPTIAIPSPPPIDGIAALPSLRTLGIGAQQAAAGNDSRFGTPTNAQYTPAALKIPLANGSGLISAGWIPDASDTARGLVSIGTQNIAGAKTFLDDFTFTSANFTANNPNLFFWLEQDGIGTGEGSATLFLDNEAAATPGSPQYSPVLAFSGAATRNGTTQQFGGWFIQDQLLDRAVQIDTRLTFNVAIDFAFGAGTPPFAIGYTGATGSYLDIGPGSTADVSTSGRARLRYNNSLQTLEGSFNGGSWVGIGASIASWKASVRAISLTNITLSGTQTVDGVALIAGDRILVAGQTLGQNNGIYVVAAGAWSRSTDANTSVQFPACVAVFVEEGTVNADTAWVLITNNPIVLGTTPLAFTAFSTTALVAGSGISKSGNTISVNQGFSPTWTGTHTFSIAPLFSTMTLGSVLFAGTSGVLSQDNGNFFWDNTNKRLGIGTTLPGFTGGIVDTPGAQLHLSNASTHSMLLIESTAAASDAGIWIGTTTNGCDFALWMDESDSQKVKFSVGANNTHSQRVSNAKMTLTQAGRLGIGTTGPGSLLSVNGGVSIGSTYAGTGAPTDGLIVVGFTGIGTTSATGSQNLEVRNSNGNAVGGQFAMRNMNPVGQGEFDVFDHNGTFRLSMGFDNNSAGGSNPDAYYYTGSNTSFIFQTNNANGIACQRADGNWMFGSATFTGISNTVASQHRVAIYKDVTWPGDTIDSQLALVGKTDASKILSIGVDTSGTHGYGFIAAGHQAVQWTFLSLQPSGGQVAIGNTAPGTFLDIADGSGGNAAAIALRSGQNSAVSASNTGRIRYNSTTQHFEVSENGGAYQQLFDGARADVSDFLLTTTSPTVVTTLTPGAQGNFFVNIYYRVITATTNLTLTLTWTDGTGAQTQNILTVSPEAVGSVSVVPVFINATAAAITVSATAGTANQIYVSTNIKSA